MQLPAVLVFVGTFFLIYAAETLWPLFAGRKQRLWHGMRNLSFFVINSLFLAFFNALITSVLLFLVQEKNWGLYNRFTFPYFIRLTAVIVTFDLWMYIWHRMAHQIPIIWRFHRMHHSDRQMDVTTAFRFHPGEILLSSIIRLPVYLLIGIRPMDLVLYQTLMMPVILLHHSNFYIPGSMDRVLRQIIVTPWMHWVHHSDKQPETDSNFGTIFSWWDRLAKTFRLRETPREIIYGLEEYKDEHWLTLWGMLKTPFVNVR